MFQFHVCYVQRIQNIIFIFYTVFSSFALLEVICMVLCGVVLYNASTADHDIVIMCPECRPDTTSILGTVNTPALVQQID